MTRHNRGFAILPDFSGFICFAIFAALVSRGSSLLNCADTFWHIKAGTVMLERGEILTHDIFSHTAYGKPWTAHEWLAEIIMASLHRVAGLPGVVVFYCLLAALTFWLLFKIANMYAGELVSALCVGVAFLLAKGHLLARPHLFTWLLGVITLYLLIKGGRLLYILPFLTALWANLHGGVLLGLVLQGIFLVGHILECWPIKEIFAQRYSIARECKKPIVKFSA